MRLSLRFIIPLVLALAAIAYAVVPLVGRLTLRWAVRDKDIRSNLIANAINNSIQDSMTSGSHVRTLGLFNKIIRDERLYALGFCGASGGSRRTPILQISDARI